MLDMGVIISIVLSGIVAAVEIFTFIDNRSIRKERSLNTFAKTTDLDTIRASITRLFSLIEDQNDKLANIGDDINANSTDIAVIKERISNEKEFINKLDDKLSKILDELYKE